MQKAVCWDTNHEGGGGVFSQGVSVQIPGNRLQMSSGRNTPTCVYPPVENLMCTAFKDYKEVPETIPLDLLEDDSMWMEFKISGSTGALGAEAIDMRNWLLRFGCVSEEFKVVVTNLADWVTNSSSP